MKIDEILAKLREDAVRDLVPYIESAKPRVVNDQLCKKFYEFTLKILSVKVYNQCDRVMLVEDVFTSLDHDLSDYLMLGEYQVSCETIESEQDVIFNIRLTYEKDELLTFRISLLEASLMMKKRSRELA